MPIYEYVCVEHGAFDRLEPRRPDGTDSYGFVAPCPECGEFGIGRISVSSHRMSESYTVLDGEGRVHKCNQSTSNMPQEIGYRYGNPNLVEV